MSNNYPFDLVGFIKDNGDLVKRYLKKDTMSVMVPDFAPEKGQLYQNNNVLVNHRATFNYSELQKLEYIKCMRNVVYFARKYVKIISIDDGVIPFDLYPYQEELLEKFQKNRFVISMQCRQSGKTQTTATFILHYATFTPSKTVAILANKAAQAREILSRIQMSHEGLPNFLKQGVRTYNKGSMKYGNLSEIFCASSSSSSVRGRSISLAYIDEAAFVPRDMEFYESTYPTISSGKESRVIITSTPNGARGLFYKLWTESVEGVNMFVRVEVPWNKVPGRDAKWRKEQISNTSIEQFNQEHGLIFRGSQNSLLSSDTLARLVTKRPTTTHGDLKIFKDPEPDHIYLTIVDTSRGVGGDYSAFVVFDVTKSPFEVAATYKNNRISPMVYPQIIRTVADKYNSAYILVEINDIGEQVASILYYDFEYDNILMCFSERNKQTIGFIKDARPGVRTTNQVKSIGCSNVKTLIENDQLLLNDEDIISEFGTFIPKGRSYEADSGAHDDLAMCCVIFAWAMVQQFMIDTINKDISKDVRDSDMMKNIMEDIMPFGFIDSGDDEVFSPDENGRQRSLHELGIF